ncbi:hypothetical protein B0H11DRAFT_1725246, partial [Mycena galericulata]
IQGSAVPCKRVFSSSAQTDTDRRNIIGPELMEALQMLNSPSRKAADSILHQKNAADSILQRGLRGGEAQTLVIGDA